MIEKLILDGGRTVTRPNHKFCCPDRVYGDKQKFTPRHPQLQLSFPRHAEFSSGLLKFPNEIISAGVGLQITNSASSATSSGKVYLFNIFIVGLPDVAGVLAVDSDPAIAGVLAVDCDPAVAGVFAVDGDPAAAGVLAVCG